MPAKVLGIYGILCGPTYLETSLGFPIKRTDSSTTTHGWIMAENNKFVITLRENGLHSLSKGVEAFSEYYRSADPMLLKEAIMFLHHGVELLMKEILVQHSPSLIFEDVRNAATKQIEANNIGVRIFYLKRPPKTVSYEDAVARVRAFVRPAGLDDDLAASLEDLNQLRNQLEHYAIEADLEEVVRLLSAIHEPLLSLFESELGGIRRSVTPRARQTWLEITLAAQSSQEAERGVADLAARFNGQRVPGRLLNLQEDHFLPTCGIIKTNYRNPEVAFEIDVLAKSDTGSWVIEVKASSVTPAVIIRLALAGNAINATPWLVTFKPVSGESRELSRLHGILLTGPDELKELERLVEDTAEKKD